jgi:predicted transcriptional regulator
MSMKSVRLDARTEARLKEAARLARVSESRIIRDAVAQHTDAILANRLDYQMADLVGSVASDQPTADRAHEAYGEALQKEVRQKGATPRRRGHPKSRS